MKVDADGSGLLDEGEVRQVMIDMGKCYSDEEFAEVVRPLLFTPLMLHLYSVVLLFIPLMLHLYSVVPLLLH